MPHPRFLVARLPAPLAALALSAMLACDPSAGSGTLVAYWHLGGMTCEDAGIATARVRVVTGTTDLVPPVDTSCDQGGAGVTIPDVPAGERQVVVEGLDDRGAARYEGRSEVVTIPAGQEILVPSVALGLRRAAVRVRWGFTNNLVCGANGVASIRLTAFDGPGNLVAGPDVHPCDVPLDSGDPEGGVILEGLPANTDLTLVVLGFSVVERPTFGASRSIRILPGETMDEAVLLDKCDAGAPCP